MALYPRFPEIVSALTWGFMKVQGGFHGSTKLVSRTPPERVKITVTMLKPGNKSLLKSFISTKQQSSTLGLIFVSPLLDCTLRVDCLLLPIFQ